MQKTGFAFYVDATAIGVKDVFLEQKRAIKRYWLVPLIEDVSLSDMSDYKINGVQLLLEFEDPLPFKKRPKTYINLRNAK